MYNELYNKSYPGFVKFIFVTLKAACCGAVELYR